MAFKEYAQTYVKKHADYSTERDRLRAKKEQIQGQLERLEKRIDKQGSEHPFWVEEIIKPIAKELTEYLDVESYSIYGPFGMTANTHIHFYKDGKVVANIDFRPTDLSKGVVSVGDYTNYTPDHVKDPNLFRTPLVEVPQAANCAWFSQFLITD